MTSFNLGELALLAVAAAGPAGGAEPLPALNVDTDAVTVSGISSGGYMAHQLHVAHAATIAGAAAIAAGPYHCAGDGYPWNLARAITVCADAGLLTPFLGPPDVGRLVAETRARAAAGAIDDPANLADDPVFLFSGALDDLVPTPVVAVVGDYYRRFEAAGRIAFVEDVPAAHGMVAAEAALACDIFESPFIIDCDYDLAGELLQHLYGALDPPEAPGAVAAFDQSAFGGGAAAAGLARIGYVYLPERCAAGARCRLHVAFHGCLQGADFVGTAFVAQAGYNGWAEANDIVVLYPQIAAPAGLLGLGLLSENPMGCWDWWGYTGPDYHLQSGPQIRAVKAMIDRLAGAE